MSNNLYSLVVEEEHRKPIHLFDTDDYEDARKFIREHRNTIIIYNPAVIYAINTLRKENRNLSTLGAINAVNVEHGGQPNGQH